MPALEAKEIAIVGGGPGGLTLARLLQLRGADVKVYERDQSRDARVQGSALDLHEHSGLAALEEAGLMEQFWANHRPDLNQLRLTDETGRVLHDHPRTMQGEGKRPEIERGPLRDILLGSLAPDTVVWDSKLDSSAFVDGKVRLTFANGKSVLTDVAIGADGSNSKLRALVTSIRPEYVGVSLVEGVVKDGKNAVPELWTLLDDAALIALGGERTIGMGTKPDGSILFYAGVKTDDAEAKHKLDDATGAKRVAWFHTNFPGWSEMWAPLLEQAVSMVWRPLLVCPRDQHWASNSNATVIGDAAHVMPPYAGEGVNMAMLDALVLSRELLRASDVASAIAAYEAEMFARMQHMTADTMSNTEMFYAPDAARRVVGMFKSFGGRDAVPPAAEA